MRAIDLAINAALPPELRRPSHDLSKKGMAVLLSKVAESYPDRYAKIARTIGDLGRIGAYRQGNTVSTSDLRPLPSRALALQSMDREVKELERRRDFYKRQDPEGRKGDYDKAFRKDREAIWLRYSDALEKQTMEEALAQGNNLAKAVASGARGKAGHLKSLVATPGLFANAAGNIVPLFVRHSYGEGLRPAESLAGAYGARAAVTATKHATAAGGDFGKILAQAGANMTVTTRDCGTSNGIDLDPMDSSVRNRVLARDAGTLEAGSVLDRKAVAQARKRDKPLIVRSAATCEAEAGVCAKCMGLEPTGKFPEVGSSVGITAAQAISEPIVQGSLNCLVEGTLVRMADGSLRRIEDIKKGEWVVGSDLKGNLKPTRVVNTWDQGMQPAASYEFRIGSTKRRVTLEATSAHKVLLNTKTSGKKSDKFNHLGRVLPVGKKLRDVGALPSREFEPVGCVDIPEAFMHGLWMGDGCRFSSPASACIISCADDTLAAWINSAHPGKKFVKKKRSFDYAYVNDTAGGDNRSGGVKNHFNKQLRDWGVAFCYCHEKFIPGIFKTASQKSLCEFIAGYTIADGSIYETGGKTAGISWGSTSKQLLLDLQDLLDWRLGIKSSAVTKTGSAGEGNRTHDIYALTVTNAYMVVRFLTLVGPYVRGVKSAFVEPVKAVAQRLAAPLYRMVRGRIGEERDLGFKHCYDIEVDNETSLFALANGMIVSNTKHQGGAASGKKEFSGFDYISQFTQVPGEFKDRAAVALKDGLVTEVSPAPQGGTYVRIDDEEHYVLPGFEAEVKVGDEVEAGQILSGGLANPREVTELRGLGRGRRYWTSRLSEILSDSGNPPDRRNIEVLSRAVLGNVKIPDPDDLPGINALPDAVVDERRAYKAWKPKDVETRVARHAMGRYLTKPVLHYTPGTRVTPRIVERLDKLDWGEVETTGEEPPFQPHMERLRTSSHNNEDWLASLQTSYLKKQLINSAEGGDVTNVESNTHFAPRLARGVDFGKDIARTGKF